MIARIPWRLIGYAALALLLLFGANQALGYLPFTPQWQARQLSKKVGQLESEVSTMEREATGNAEIAAATQTFHTREVVIRDLTRQAEVEARNAPDAETPLTPDRVDRIRSADNRLCLAHPRICPDPDPS